MFNPAHNVANQAGSLVSSGVMIVRHSNGQFIKASTKAGSQNGSIMLREEATVMRGSFTDDVVKVAFIRGTISQLGKIVQKFANKTMPGRLWVREFLESDPQVAELIAEDLAYFKGDYERALGKKVKTNPKNGQVLTKDGERIIRFVDYDMSGATQDVYVSHDRFPGSSQFQADLNDLGVQAPSLPVNQEQTPPSVEGQQDVLF